MSAITLSIGDQGLWNAARKAAGNQGLSSLVERALREHLQEPEDEAERRFVLPIGNNDGGDHDMGNSIQFEGQLLTDSSGFSLEQLPRIRVYRTVKGRLVVYRTWPSVFSVEPRYSAYEDLRSLESDGLALATTWITDEDRFGEGTDLTDDLLGSLKSALGRQNARSIDALKPSELAGGNYKRVRLGRDTETIADALTGAADLDVLLVAMHLLASSAAHPKHLSEIEDVFKELKPVSRLGNSPDDLKDFQAGMRGYLNNNTRKQSPAQRLFANPKRGFWGLSAVGNGRAVEVFRRLGMVHE
jgi:hypothetical protein